MYDIRRGILGLLLTVNVLTFAQGQTNASDITVATQTSQSVSKDLDILLTEIRATKQILNPSAISTLDSYPAVAAHGPNVLSEIIARYKTEDDISMRRQYAWLIRLTGKVALYTPHAGDTTWSQSTTFTAVLLPEEKTLPPDELTLRLRDRTIQWLESDEIRRGAAKEIENLTTASIKNEKPSSPITAYSTSEFVRIKAFGIYNLPALIATAKQSNNPWAFLEFLRASGHRELYNSGSGANWIQRAQTMESRFPTMESKSRLIDKWWKDKQHTYSNFPELQQAIDREVSSSISAPD